MTIEEAKQIIPKCETCKQLYFPYNEGNKLWGKNRPCCRRRGSWTGNKKASECYCEMHEKKEF